MDSNDQIFFDFCKNTENSEYQTSANSYLLFLFKTDSEKYLRLIKILWKSLINNPERKPELNLLINLLKDYKQLETEKITLEEQKYEIEDLQMDVEHKNMLKNLIIDKEKEADSYVVQGLNILTHYY